MAEALTGPDGWRWRVDEMPLVSRSVDMKNEFSRLLETWRALGTEDPYWAVISWEEKRKGKWRAEEFLATGERDVSLYQGILGQAGGGKRRYDHVLDFGCGLGRLTRAWSFRADRVCGVDISESMIDQARRLNRDRENIQFVANEEIHLQRFGDGEFDLVFSMICLQHMPWNLARKYLGEFHRVCRRGGIVAFQLPSQNLKPSRTASLRQKIVDRLPFGLDRKYRRWQHGTSVVFEMHFTPSPTVVAFGEQLGMKLLRKEPDPSAGPDTEGFFYVFQRPE